MRSPSFEPEPLDPEEQERRAAVRELATSGPAAAQQLARTLVDPNADFRQVISDSLLATGSSALPTLLELLGAERAEVRAWAAAVLGRLNDPAATGPLMVRLTDAAAAVRSTVAEALGNLKDKRAVEPLVWMAEKDTDETCRASALWALRSISSLLLKPHLPMLQSPDLETRLRAREAICSKGRGTVPGVIDLLRHESLLVRSAAAEILGKLRDERAVPGLLAALDDREESVRSAAALALGQVRTRAAVQGLIPRLAGSDSGSSAKAATALVGQGESAVPALIELLSGESRDARLVAINVLGRIRDRRAAGPLQGLLAEPDVWVRGAAARALGQLGEQDAGPRLLEMLDDPATAVRVAAADALGELRYAAAAARLLSLAGDGELPLRGAAIRALGALGDQRALPRLIEVASDRELTVRVAAIEALGRYRSERVAGLLRRLARPWPFGREPAAVRAAARAALDQLPTKV